MSVYFIVEKKNYPGQIAGEETGRMCFYQKLLGNSIKRKKQKLWIALTDKVTSTLPEQ